MKNTGGRESAVISGITNYDGVIDEESHLTTPESFEIYKHMYNAVNSGIEYLTMEVSSQGLKYDRTKGIMYDIGCFLNIGNDHISGIEHSRLEDYLTSKLILFSQSRTVCINSGSDKIGQIMAAAEKVGADNEARGIDMPEIVTFGHESEDDYFVYDITSPKGESGSITFSVKAPGFDERFELSMRGLFNVDNALAAIAMTSCLGIPVEYIKAGLKKARVSGRMEFFTSSKRGYSVIVDYAHNQMSFETLFRSVKKEFPARRSRSCSDVREERRRTGDRSSAISPESMRTWCI
ncbi:MAG: Mur ligase family protein [Clostridia bacterium]